MDTDALAQMISIHALCEEGDQASLDALHLLNVFLSTPSARRATGGFIAPDGRKLFLSTPSARRATDISEITAQAFAISIHALCEEGDRHSCSPPSSSGSFLSTPSARRATIKPVLMGVIKDISIHALCEEGDTSSSTSPATPADFYPRPLRGGRRAEVDKAAALVEFLSTPSARRATVSSAWLLQQLQISIHALCEEGDEVSVIPAYKDKISIHALCEEGDTDI